MGNEATDAGTLWGVKAIARAIGRGERQTYHLLVNGRLPAKQVGSTWFSTRKAIDEFFEGIPAPSGEAVRASN